MSSKQSSGDGIESPDDILNSYLDDLLGGEDPLGFALEALDTQIAPLAANAGSARVVPLPTKKTVEKSVEKIPAERSEKSRLRTELPHRASAETQSKAPPKTSSRPRSVTQSKSSFADPEIVQTQEQKLKLEKLLQSARTQLLVETPAEVPTRIETKTSFINNPEEIQDWIIETPEITIAPEITPVIELTPTEHLQPTHFQLEGLEWLENGRPQWAQSRFDVLLFQVSGLTLAVPLISLGQIQPLTDELTPLFGQADWFMGLQPTPAGKIRTVNTAKFVMPERYDESFVKTAKYVVSINGVPWGLAVDSVNQPITLQPDDVKWRGDRSKRPWLAGTVKEHMCALLDIPRIGQMLIDADKNFIPAQVFN